MSTVLFPVREFLRVGQRAALLLVVGSLGGIVLCVSIVTRSGLLLEITGVAFVLLVFLLSLRWPLLALLAFAVMIPIEELTQFAEIGTPSRLAGLLFAVAYGIPRVGRLTLRAMPPAAWAYVAFATLSIGWALDPQVAIGEIQLKYAGCAGTLQARIDTALAGSVLDLTGCIYTAGATVNKSLTIKGATVRPPAGTAGLVVSANDVTLDGLNITGPQATTYHEGEFGITVAATASAPVRRLTVRNCEISSFGKAGIWLRYVSDLVVEHNDVHDIVYAGIMLISVVDGSVTGNTVARLGMNGSGVGAPAENDAYSISVEDQGAPRSSDVVVEANVVEDNPYWHGLDTHGGLRITFRNNVVRRCSRGLFVTASSASGSHATDIVVAGNNFVSPDPATFNLVPITLAAVYGATFTGNTITGWGGASPTSAQPWYDYLNQSTGLVNGGGNTVAP